MLFRKELIRRINIDPSMVQYCTAFLPKHQSQHFNVCLVQAYHIECSHSNRCHTPCTNNGIRCELIYLHFFCTLVDTIFQHGTRRYQRRLTQFKHRIRKVLYQWQELWVRLPSSSVVGRPSFPQAASMCDVDDVVGSMEQKVSLKQALQAVPLSNRRSPPTSAATWAVVLAPTMIDVLGNDATKALVQSA